MRLVENDQGNSHPGSGAGERATGRVKALTQRAPSTRDVRVTLENMIVWSVVRKNR